MDKIALKNKINLLQKQIAELQGQIDTVEKMPLNQRLAEVLHSKLCHWNHADGCSWAYEKWENYQSGHAKKKYLDKANDLIKKFPIDVEILIEIIDAL